MRAQDYRGSRVHPTTLKDPFTQLLVNGSAAASFPDTTGVFAARPASVDAGTPFTGNLAVIKPANNLLSFVFWGAGSGGDTFDVRFTRIRSLINDADDTQGEYLASHLLDVRCTLSSTTGSGSLLIGSGQKIVDGIAVTAGNGDNEILALAAHPALLTIDPAGAELVMVQFKIVSSATLMNGAWAGL